MQTFACLVIALTVGAFGQTAMGTESAESDGGEYRLNRDVDGREVWEDKHGRFVTIPRNLVEEPGPSGESLRAQGFVYVDRNSGDSLRGMGQGRYIASFKNLDGTAETLELQVGSRIAPDLNVVVSLENGKTSRYTYSLANGLEAEHEVLLFNIRLTQGGILLNQLEARGWRAGGGVLRGVTTFGWFPWPSDGGGMLAPGEQVENLWVTSRYLPALTEFAVRGSPQQGPTTPLPYELHQEFIKRIGEEEWIRGLTVGPMIEPPGEDYEKRMAAIGHLEGDIDTALGAELIDQVVASQLRNLLSEARSNADTPAILAAVADRVARIQGMDDSYRGGIEVALRVLAGD